MNQHVVSVFTQVDRESEAQAKRGRDHIALKASVIDKFQNEGLQADEVYKILGVNSKTQIVKSAREGGDLTPEQSERASRIAHIVSLAEHVFSSREKAFLWLRLPNSHFGDRLPFDTLVTESGARFVEEALLQIGYGVYA